MQEDCLINFGGGALQVIHCAAFSSMSHVHLMSGPGDEWTLTSGSRLKNLEVLRGIGAWFPTVLPHPQAIVRSSGNWHLNIGTKPTW